MRTATLRYAVEHVASDRDSDNDLSPSHADTWPIRTVSDMTA